MAYPNLKSSQDAVLSYLHHHIFQGSPNYVQWQSWSPGSIKQDHRTFLGQQAMWIFKCSKTNKIKREHIAKKRKIRDSNKRHISKKNVNEKSIFTFCIVLILRKYNTKSVRRIFHVCCIIWNNYSKCKWADNQDSCSTLKGLSNTLVDRKSWHLRIKLKDQDLFSIYYTVKTENCLLVTHSYPHVKIK